MLTFVQGHLELPKDGLRGQLIAHSAFEPIAQHRQLLRWLVGRVESG